jgi:hypothetical protein
MTDRSGGTNRNGRRLISVATIPEDLRKRPQWVCWRSEEREGGPTKIPYNALTGKWASSTNPSTWTTFEKAMAALDEHPEYDGVGYVFSDADPFCGVDLDDCIGEDGTVESWAREIIDGLSTYAEISPSGRGVKLFLRGELPPGGNRKGKIEIYDRARYFTVTSQHLPGTPSTIEDRQPELEALHAELFGKSACEATPVPDESRACNSDADDEELLARARAAKNGAKLAALFDRGEIAAYEGDDSAADLALCSLLAYWCGPDPQRLDRLFRQSALMRPKWDAMRGESTYGARTLAKALEGVTSISGGRGPGEDSKPREPKEIVADLEALDDEPDLGELQRLVQELGPALAGSDALSVAIHREASIKALRGKVKSPARIVDAVLAELPNKAGEEAAQGRAVAFTEPEPWPEPVDGSVLLDSLSATFERYVVLQRGRADALALWVVHTFALAVAWITPRLAITSPVKRCAKTLLLDVLERLVSKPRMTSNVTAAAVFRTVEKFQPTLLVDEGDTFLAGKDELRGILNSGHRRGGSVLRVAGDDHEPRQFATFSPVAIAMIGKLPGDTLEDRSIEIEMRRKKREETVEAFRFDRLAHLEELRRFCARWTQDHLDELRQADPDIPSELHDRAADNWRPLLAIADAAGGEWSAKARRAAVTLSGTEAIEDSSVGSMLLADIRDVFRVRNVDVLASKTLLADLLDLEERPWGEWRHGQPLTARGLAKLVKSFGIQPRQLRIGTDKTRGYRSEWFEDSFARYLPPDPVHPVQTAPGAGLRRSAIRYKEGDVPDAKTGANPDGKRVVPDVPDTEPGVGGEDSGTWGEI